MQAANTYRTWSSWMANFWESIKIANKATSPEGHGLDVRFQKGGEVILQ